MSILTLETTGSRNGRESWWRGGRSGAHLSGPCHRAGTPPPRRSRSQPSGPSARSSGWTHSGPLIGQGETHNVTNRHEERGGVQVGPDSEGAFLIDSLISSLVYTLLSLHYNAGTPGKQFEQLRIPML